MGIVGIGSDAPEGLLTNADLERMVETSNDWIVERTGIRSRHIADENTTTSMIATNAARRALADAGIDGSEVDLIVVGTATPDMLFPSTACLIQAEIGATKAAAFDLAAACSGFIYGVNVAAGMIRNGTHSVALVIGAETLSKIVDYQDRSTCVLFGDGAGAVVLRKVDNGSGILASRIQSDGKLADELKLPGGGSLHPASHDTVDAGMHFLQMNGNSVFKSAVRCMADVVQGVLDDAGLTNDDIDLFIPHQANIRIIDATAKKLRMPKEKVFVNVDRYGNTSAASVPIGMDEARREGRLKKGDLVAAVAFGAGFTWGAFVARI
ncbi:ketoacyl-ACP synthase III [bacterium]|nr:ketoacyl-ACP synthase III [bacterium]